MSSKSTGSSPELPWEAAQQWCVYLQEQEQELTWQLGEAQRQIGEARCERDQLKADIEQTLQATKEAKVQIVLRTSREVVDRCHFAKALLLLDKHRPAPSFIRATLRTVLSVSSFVKGCTPGVLMPRR